MSLRARLTIGLVAIAVILVGPLIIAIGSLHRLHDDTRELQQKEFAASLLLGRLRESLNGLRRQELALLFTRDSAARATLTRQVDSLATMADSLERFQLPTPARDIEGAVEQIAAAVPAEDQAMLAGQPKRADTISLTRFVPAVSRADSAIGVAEHALRTRTSEMVSAASQEIARTQTISVGALALALVLAAFIALRLTRSISRPVEDLATGMRAVADGDLTYRIGFSAERRDEFGRLAESFKDMTEQLGELDKLKAEFVSVASHELKTPINVIIGYLQLLEEGIYGPLSPKQLEIHKTLGLQAHALLRLVNQLLDVSRFEAGGGRIEPRRTPLAPLLSQLEDAFHVLAVQRGIQFNVIEKDGLPTEVTWDVDRVNEVLGNLLSNAFKFTPRGGSVSLTIEPVDGSVAMEVADTGAGIPADQLPRVFDKFYQADNQAAATLAGSGLGLAIAKHIVDAHGGTIQCDSTVGVGTTFTLLLPVQVTRRTSSHHQVVRHVST